MKEEDNDQTMMRKNIDNDEDDDNAEGWMIMMAPVISQVNNDDYTGENITGTKRYKYLKSIAWC